MFLRSFVTALPGKCLEFDIARSEGESVGEGFRRLLRDFELYLHCPRVLLIDDWFRSCEFADIRWRWSAVNSRYLSSCAAGTIVD